LDERAAKESSHDQNGAGQDPGGLGWPVALLRNEGLVVVRGLLVNGGRLVVSESVCHWLCFGVVFAHGFFLQVYS
jgi:hypothetical protein